MNNDTRLNQLRQGDVYLRRVNKVEGKIKKQEKTGKNRVVLAHGEVTGHAHAAYKPGATLTETEEKRFLEITQSLGVDHEEHDTLPLVEGDNFEVITQVEYTPEEIRRVAD